MIRALILLFSSCWALLLLLPRARNHKFKEIFRVPRFATAALIILVSTLFTAEILYNYAPQAGDAAYYYGQSNRFMFTGHLPSDGHELSLGFISLARLGVERVLGLPLSASIASITFLLTALYCLAVYKFAYAGTNNRFISILAIVLAPFSMFTFWFVFGGVYAQFLSLSFLLLGSAYFFQQAPLWKPAMFFLLGTLTHIWSAMVFILAFVLFISLSKLLKYKDFVAIAKKAIKTLAISLSALFIIGLVFHYWAVFIEVEHFKPNSLLFSGLGESPLIAGLAFVGIFVSVTRKIPFCLFLYSMALVTSAALFIYSSSVICRVVFLFPLPVLAAIGIHRIKEKIPSKLVGSIAVIGLICATMLLSVHVDKKYIDAQQLSVSQTQDLQTVDEIQGIVETYGYDNYELLIVIERQNYDLLIWAEALTSAKVVTMGPELDDALVNDYVPDRKIIYLGVN